MADFFSKAQALGSETIELLGEKIEVRGLSIGDLVALNKMKDGDDQLGVTSKLIALCCYTNGKRLVPEEKVEELRKFNPAVYNALNDAVTRVNASTAGNSKATGRGA